MILELLDKGNNILKIILTFCSHFAMLNSLRLLLLLLLLLLL